MTSHLSTYLSMFERAEQGRPGEPQWLRALRRSAIDEFGRVGFPTTSDEQWRFTSVAPIAGTAFVEPPRAAVSSDQAAALATADPGGPRFVFVDGRFAPALSSPGAAVPGVTVLPLASAALDRAAEVHHHLGRHAAVEGRAFAALNTASFEDGAFVSVAEGAAADRVIELLFLSTPTPRPAVAHPRVLVVMGRDSRARIVQTYASLGPTLGFTNAVEEFVVGDGASLEHCRVQRESTSSFHVGHTQYRLGRSSRVSAHAVALGGLIARHDVVAELGGEGADCTLDGLYHAAGLQLVDNHTEIDHAAPHGTSRELYKGILDGRARGVFNGRIRVRPDARRTDAKQTNRTLLLSGDARVNTTPQLEILASDVKCTHGATVGQLSADALFFLRARGIGAEQARGMLIRAFLADLTARIPIETAREGIDRLLAARLPGGPEPEGGRS
jgi:Fe-S cluster assembly protein SufD